MKNKKNLPLYRAQLSCKIGRDALEGTTDPPPGCTAIDWALFQLLHAIEEIATAMMSSEKDNNR